MALLPSDRDQRWLAVGNLVNMTGTGATLAALVVFLAEVKHLPLSQASFLLAASGLIGVLGAVPIGQSSDRFGARRVAIVAELACAAATIGLLAAGNVWLCAVCLAARQLATSGNTAARATLMGRLVPSEQRARLRAYQRSVSNVGFALGAVASGTVIAIGSPAALYGLLIFDAATFCFGAFATARLPEVGLGVKGRSLALDAFTDKGYMAVGILNAVHSLNRAAVSIGIPLWVVYGSTLPHWTISAALITNTVVVTFFQVPFSSRAQDVTLSRSALRAAGYLTAAGCAALAIGGVVPDLAVWPLFAVACLTLAFGEILGAAAGWTLSYDLAPDDLLGQYQGAWQLIADASVKVGGPAILGWTVASGAWGWTALAVGFGTVAAASPEVIEWASSMTVDEG